MSTNHARFSTLLFTALLAFATAAPAGTISVAWDPVTDADLAGYRVYWGTAPGNYTQQQDVGAGTTTLQLVGLADCASYYVAVKARDTAGNLSAAFSNEVAGMPRPMLAQIQPAAAEQGLPLTIVIVGSNFAPGATVRFGNPNVTVGSVTVNSCTQITATITVGPSAATGTTTVDVTNADQVFGTSSGLFTVQTAAAPSVVAIAPASLTTGVAVNVRPTITFSEAMKPSTILASTVKLLDPAGNAVAQAAGSPALSTDGKTATVVPAANLDFGKTYRVQVVGGASGVRDLANVAMASTYVQASGFTTVPDSAAPAISSVAATNVQATSALVTWTTDEPSDSQVFYRRAGEVSYQQTALDSALVTNHSVLIQGLSPSTVHAFYVQSADSAGNRAASSADGSFTTAASSYTYLIVEAESGSLTPPMRQASGSGAFRGAWIETPSGTPTGGSTAPAGKSDLPFHVPADGTWYVWVRLYGAGTTSDAWFESVDGAARQSIAPSATGAWTWTAARSYQLTQGLHSLELGGREAQARSDRALITNDPAFVPTEQPGDDVTPPPPATGLAATASDRTISLTWTNPLADTSSVVVRYRADGRFPASPVDGFPIASRAATAGAAETQRHEGLVNGSGYWYGVFVVDGSGNASAPAQVQATPVDNAPPGAVGSAWRTDRR
jgi:chitodextrinase